MFTSKPVQLDFSPAQAEHWASHYYGIQAQAKPLVSYDDHNFLLTSEHGVRYIMKISGPNSLLEDIQGQHQLIAHLQEHTSHGPKFPEVMRGSNGQDYQVLSDLGAANSPRYLRVLQYLQGDFLSEVEHSPSLLNNFGSLLGSMGRSLQQLRIPSLENRRSPWNLNYALDCLRHTAAIMEPHYRRLAQYFLQQFSFQVSSHHHQLPQSIIHGDANDQNVLVKGEDINGLIDFGDACYSYRINELAVALPYVMMNKANPLEVAASMVRAYHQENALSPVELEVLYYLINTRLAVSLTMSSLEYSKQPQNEYLVLHQEPVKALMDTMLAQNPQGFAQQMKQSCQMAMAAPMSAQEFLEQRHLHISHTLSVNYQTPLRIYKGAMQYLYEQDGRTFLDGVNNISHVGHCHPKVVEAANKQAAELNTNTRYLYAQLNDYAARICELLPDPLSVVFFVNSGSEANDLALRIARTYTGYDDVMVLDGGYHGNSTATLEASPYKYQSRGGSGKKSYIHQAAMPDLFRGKYRTSEAGSADQYIGDVHDLLRRVIAEKSGIAGFLAESIMSCGGQIVLPSGYLKAVYKMVREVGGLCIADEVQVGFGRVGAHFWGFQSQNVIPDIVTMGKPMGNGHPLAAVVTTPEIAKAFDNGLEYFNSFGGNPVSCAIGMAVLDIIEAESLQKHAQDLGNYILKGWRELQQQYSSIGDVRGMGLFLGLELIKDSQSLEAHPALAAALVDKMYQRGILLSADGPQYNVIKFKPPMVFTKKNAQNLIDCLQTTLSEIERP